MYLTVELVLTVQAIMDSWTHQLGYPLVTLRRHGNLIHASQKHFLLVNSSVHRNASHKWYIPLSFTTSTSPKSENQIWMHDKDGKTFSEPPRMQKKSISIIEAGLIEAFPTDWLVCVVSLSIQKLA